MLQHVLAEYAVAERTRLRDEAVRHHARRALVDWFAALLAGGDRPPASTLHAVLAEELGHGDALLYPSATRAPARAAALVNGTAAHLVEFDDIFRDAIYHPGAPVIAAALACAQAEGVSGDLLVRAVIVGYEISTRLAVALTPAHYKYWHTTATAGTFGAAAAAATVLGLDATQGAHALAMSATFAAGLQQSFRSDAMSKPLHAGRAAEAGLLAAQLAARGVSGAEAMFEGELGYGNATSRDCDWTKATEGLGERYNISAMTIKNHGCCGHTFAAIDGALALAARERLRAEDIERVEVETYQVAIDVTGNTEPGGEHAARFSLPFVVATALVSGSVRLDAFSPAGLSDQRVRRLARRVALRASPELDALFPRRRAARVIVHTRDGRRFEHLQPTRKGDPDLPLSDEELADKYRELAVPVVGRDAAERLLASLWTVDAPGSLGELRGLGAGAVVAP